jgi:hypothetical protein
MEYRPGAHGVHEVAPTTPLNRPAAHFTQALSTAYWPTGQRSPGDAEVVGERDREAREGDRDGDPGRDWVTVRDRVKGLWDRVTLRVRDHVRDTARVPPTVTVMVCTLGTKPRRVVDTVHA